MTNIFETDFWILIFTVIIVIETLALVILTIKLIGKEKKLIGIIEKIEKMLEKMLEKVPPHLDPKQPPIIPKEDVKTLEKMTPIYEEKGMLNLDLLIKIGNVEYTQGNLLKALTYYEKALRQAKLTKDFITSGICLGNIGIIYMNKGDLDNALKYHREALKIHKEIGYKKGEATAWATSGLFTLTKAI